jgi:hypothetical protein
MRLWYAVPGMALVAFAAYTVYWFVSASGVEAGLVQWIERQKQAGYDIAHSGMATTGYPFALTVAVDNPIISQGAVEANWAWSSDRIEAAAGMFGLDEPVITAIGPHRLLVSRGVLTGDWRVTTERLELRPSIGTKGLTRLDAVIEQGRAEEQIDGDTFSAKSISLSVRPQEAGNGDTKEVVHMKASLDGIVLPDRAAGPLGPAVDHAVLVSTLAGPLPSRIDQQHLAVWRDAGGTMDIHALNLDWGGVEARAEGSVSLDQQFRPIGALTSRVSGYETLVDALVKGKVVRENDSAVIKAVLGLLARRDTEGRMVLKVPVTAQDGMLTMGPIPLLPLPDVISIAQSQAR